MRIFQLGWSVLAVSLLLVSSLLLACEKDKPKESTDAGVKQSEAIKPDAEKANAKGAPPASDATSKDAAKQASPFEGLIEIKIDDPSSKDIIGLSLRVKGTSLRMEPKGPAADMVGGAYVFMDLSKKDLVSVIPAQKMAIRMDFTKLKEQAASFLPADEKEPTKVPSFKKVGTSQKIAGLSCDDYQATDSSGGKQSVCMAEVGASWFSFPVDQFPLEKDFATQLFDGAHFPLQMIVERAKEGKVTATVTAMERKVLPDSDFAIPADYKVMDMNQMLGGLAGMGIPGAGSPADMKLPNGAQIPPEAAAMIEQAKAQAAAAQKAAAEKQ